MTATNQRNVDQWSAIAQQFRNATDRGNELLDRSAQATSVAELRDNISGAIGDVLPGLLSCVPDAVAQVSAFVAGTFIALFNPFERMPSASCA